MNVDQERYVAYYLGIYQIKNNFVYCGFKRNAQKNGNILRYAHPQRYFKIPDDKLKVLKNKYPNFSLTHFWEYKIKTNAKARKFLMGESFVGDIIANKEYNKPEMNLRRFVYTDKNVNENFLSSNDEIFNKTILVKPPATMRAQLNKTSEHVKHLVEEIGDISKYRVEQANYFLYDNSNMIGGAFYSELNKKNPKLRLISYFTNQKRAIARLIILQKTFKICDKIKKLQRIS